MSLRTAPCPTCTSTIVFGERRCRSCGMPFDYGASPPAEPTPAEVFDTLQALAASSSPPAAGSSSPPAAASTPPTAAAPKPAPAPPRSRSGEGAAVMEGLDTGRFEVGEVPIDDIPGFIDSTLFAVMTPAHVDVDLIQGLETTQLDNVGGGALPMAAVPGLEIRDLDVGDVTVQAVPGLFGSDLFKTDVNIAAGAAGASDILEVSPNAGRRTKAKDDDSKRRIVCATCSTVHFLSRCPSCGTAAPAAD